MGICIPRPSMRAGEERRLRGTLALHAELRKLICESGCSDQDASRIAFDIVTTRGKRKQTWRKP